MSESDRVTEVVRAINEGWTGGRYHELGRYFHPEMVLALPGFEQRIEGRARIIDSYRDFGETSTLHAFEAKVPRVDVVGPTAVAATDFTIDYALEGARYRESGTDLLVLHRSPAGWQVVWRTVVTRREESA